MAHAGVRRLAGVAALLLALCAASGAAGAKRDRTIALPLPTRDLALSGASVAWVQAPLVENPGVAGSCGQVGLWAPATGQRWTFRPLLVTCTQGASTGEGLWDVSVATRRVLWIEYVGGSFRDWFLVTASATRRKPVQLLKVTRPVESQPPLVLGPGTPAGVPYARDDTVVWFGEKGTPIFTRSLAGPVRAVAAGVGPGGLRVAALLRDGSIAGLDARGRTVRTIRAQGVVSAIRVSSLGIAVQRGRLHRGLVIPYPRVTIGSRAIPLPAGARMVDIAQGRVLWTRAGDLGATTIRARARTVLADGARAAPYFGQLEESGLAWARKRTVGWSGGAVPSR